MNAEPNNWNPETELMTLSYVDYRPYAGVAWTNYEELIIGWGNGWDRIKEVKKKFYKGNLRDSSGNVIYEFFNDDTDWFSTGDFTGSLP